MSNPVAKIEDCQVVSFRLEVPAKDFAALVEQLSATLLKEPSHWVLGSPESGCYLRFEIRRDMAHLCEVNLVDDARGYFFQQILGMLLVEYRGDFHARLAWNLPKGKRVEVRVTNGESEEPLIAALQTNKKKPQFEPRETADESKVRQYLREAQEAWAEYQHLKAKKIKSTGT